MNSNMEIGKMINTMKNFNDILNNFVLWAKSAEWMK